MLVFYLEVTVLVVRVKGSGVMRALERGERGKRGEDGVVGCFVEHGPGEEGAVGGRGGPGYGEARGGGLDGFRLDVFWDLDSVRTA